MESNQGKLLRLLGVGFGLAVTFGGTVGVGILRTPGMVAAQLPNFWLILSVWILGGIYALLGTICVVELGAALPKAGGWYVYARRAFGNYGGFVVGWSDWIAQSAAIAYVATSIGDFIVALQPAANGTLIGILIVLLFALLHWLGLRTSSQAQEWTSLIKGIALILFVAVCFLFAEKSNSLSGAMPIPTRFSSFFFAVFLAFQSVIVTYDGWYSANYFMEEDENPGRNLPRSAIGGVLATICIYLLVNLALVYALPMPQLAASKLPAADAAQKIFGGYGGRIITVLCLISLPSVINAVLLLATRILFAMSRDHLFPAKAASVNPKGTPVPAMLFTTAVSIILIASGTFEKLLAIGAFLYVAVYTSGFLSLLLLRKREPELIRPFKAWGYPWTPLLALLGSFVFLSGNIMSDPVNSVYALALIAISYPAYRILFR